MDCVINSGVMQLVGPAASLPCEQYLEKTREQKGMDADRDLDPHSENTGLEI